MLSNVYILSAFWIIFGQTRNIAYNAHHSCCQFGVAASGYIFLRDCVPPRWLILFSKLFGSKSSAKKSVAAKAAADTSRKPSAKASASKPASSKKSKPPRAKKAPKPAWSLDKFPVPEKEGLTRFHDLDLPLSMMHAIADLGFEYCSPIQAAILPHTLDGLDAVGKAQTGTGKTAAFLITAICDLLAHPIDDERYTGEPRVVVIAPTRELVMQIAKDAEDLTKHADLHVEMLIGGMDYAAQLKRVQRKVVDIVVATPGRLIDFMTRGDLRLDMVEIMVIDEADRMLDMGFIPQVRRIVRACPPKDQRQTLLFSATFTEDVIRLTEQWTIDPVRIEMEPDRVASDSVDQKVYMVGSKDKFQVLKNILKSDDVTSAIVFANRRDQTRWLYERLSKSSITCGMLSGEVAQQKRTSTLKRFKDGNIKVLVATDVAGRGIHVNGISHVINYNLPEDPEDYVHRIGRTGRAGETGTSISLACEDDAFMLLDIEELLGEKIACEQPPLEFMD
ncbi:MAG: ATP-dependent RNA helicase RhlB [Cellvibrionales bacterium]|jgi:ATP-dependent RNA helicase RhlB|nr:ATP-dependent RNA helicase RhlB [Cellvibrionales bacterium]